MAITRENIEKWSSSYAFLKYYVDFAFKFYFRTSVAGLENVPNKGTFIFTPNHQNALMDALALLSVKQWQPVFLARADIFEKPLFNKILTFLKILPVYRIRDGYQNLTKNDAVFNKTMDVLRNENGLVILPEGNHGDKKRLRPLKKGVARIAFQAEDASNGELDIKVIPVGIDYSHYVHVGSKLHIRFGIPINIKTLLGEYKENQARTYKTVIDLLEIGIKKEMIHIEDEKYYNAYMVMLNAFTKQYLLKQKLHLTHENEIDAQKLIISKIDELKQSDFDSFLVLIANTLELDMLLKKLNINSLQFPSEKSDFIKTSKHILALLCTLPLFIYSFVNNILSLGVPFIISKKIKDEQFLSSFRFGLGLLLIPIFHLIQVLVFGLISGSLVLTLAYAVSLPLSVFLYFTWREYFFAVTSPLREFILKLRNSDKLKRAKEVHANLSSKMWNLVQSKSEEEFLPNYLDE